MTIEQIDRALEQIDSKFASHRKHRKQLAALNNYSEVAPFSHKPYLRLIRTCMSEAFLADEESRFLGHLVDKYSLNFLDWSVRNPWLKNEMRRVRVEQQVETQPLLAFAERDALPLFTFEPKAEQVVPVRVPVEVLSHNNYRSPWATL